MKNHAALILHNRDKILFIKRSAVKKMLPNMWAVPSGTMEEGETVEMTALREAKEELGIDIVIENVIATVELPELESRLHFVSCKSLQDIIHFDQTEIQTTAWMTFEEFFNTYTDEQIGHGLRYLRKHQKIIGNKIIL